MSIDTIITTTETRRPNARERKLMRINEQLGTLHTERDELIKELKATGLTSRVIGALAGLSHTQVNNILRGPRPSTKPPARRGRPPKAVAQ